MFGDDLELGHSEKRKTMQVTNQHVLRDIEYKTGITLDEHEVRRFLSGAVDPRVTEEVTEIALAMSSHACGHGWGTVTADDVSDLLGMVEMEPLATAADLRCRVPQCWWKK